MELTSEDINDRDTGRTKRITGFLIGAVSTKMGPPDQHRTEPKARWGDNRVWKLRDGTYVLVREFWSRIYHTNPTRCHTANSLQSGEEMTVADMAEELGGIGFSLDDAIACEHCRPMYVDDLPSDAVIRYEVVRRTIGFYAQAVQVIAVLTRIPRAGGFSYQVPRAMKELLSQCEENDPDWYEEDDERAVEHIG